jgi:hypothetical protein
VCSPLRRYRVSLTLVIRDRATGVGESAAVVSRNSARSR